CRRCCRRPAGGGAFVEVNQFLLEALLEGRDLLASPGPAGGRRAAFRAEDRGRASQEWGGEGEGQPPVRRVEGELHLVPSDAGEVDPGQDEIGLAVGEDRRE